MIIAISTGQNLPVNLKHLNVKAPKLLIFDIPEQIPEDLVTPCT